MQNLRLAFVERDLHPFKLIAVGGAAVDGTLPKYAEQQDRGENGNLVHDTLPEEVLRSRGDARELSPLGGIGRSALAEVPQLLFIRVRAIWSPSSPTSAGARSRGRRAGRIARGFPFPYGFQHLAADADGAAGITGADHSADEPQRPIASLDLHPDRTSNRELVIRSSVADHPILRGGNGTCLETLPPPRRKVRITCVICDLLEQTGAGVPAQPEMSDPRKGIAQEYATVVAARIAMLDPPLNGRESA